MNDKIKDQALKYCVDIYKHYNEFEIQMQSLVVNRAWQVGESVVASSPNKKLQSDGLQQCPCNSEVRCPMDEPCDGCEETFAAHR